MTEAEWLECADPTPMLEFLQGKASERKLRLFAVACCRRMWSLLDDDRKKMLVNDGMMAVEMAKKDADRDRLAVELAEKCADGLVDHAALKALYPAADDKEDADCHGSGSDAAWTANASAYHARFLAMYFGPTSYPPGAKLRSASQLEHDREQSAQWAVLRCIFGNPFRSITLDPSWLNPTVTALAQSIYDDRTFDQLPLLADALVKSGCAVPEILEHCKGPGVHVRGCWVVDEVLGKR